MEKEQIQLYQSFHYHVKSSLIRQISNDSIFNLQIGCHDVKDIHLWERHYNGKLSIVDINDRYVSELNKRYRKCNIRKDFKFENCRDYKLLPKVNNIFIPNFPTAFTSVNNLDYIFNIISNCLNVGGYFVGTLVDGDSVLELLAGSHFFKNNVGFVKKLYFNTSNQLNHSIKIGLPNKLFLNQRTIEMHYIGYKSILQLFAKQYNLELVFWKKYHQYNFKSKQYTINEYRILLDIFSSFMFKKIE